MSEYLTVSQYAALIGVSEKTARKRITRGDVEADRVALPGGGWAWHVYPERLEAVGNRLEVQNECESDQTNERLESVTEAVGTLPTAKLPTVPTEATTALLAEKDARIADLRAQIDAWRLQAEASNRTASETAAALREALKAMPKALPGENTPDAEKTTRYNAPQGAQTAPGDQTPAAQKQGARRGKKPRKIRPWQKAIMRVIKVKL
jgi:uncharacterized small protein (DUF1192 family)